MYELSKCFHQLDYHFIWSCDHTFNIFSILDVLRKHCSSEYVNGICNKNVEDDFPEIESVYQEMD